MNANLSGAILTGNEAYAGRFVGADLREASLDETVLEGAHFSGADLSMADFTGAVLRMASLDDTKCRAAIFIDADLTYADLSRADLTAADFSGCKLVQANLHRIVEERTLWRDSDRSGARGTDPALARAEDWKG